MSRWPRRCKFPTTCRWRGDGRRASGNGRGASPGLGLDLAAELRTRDWAVVATARDTTGAARLTAVAARPGSSLVDRHRRCADGRRTMRGSRGDPYQDAAGRLRGDHGALPDQCRRPDPPSPDLSRPRSRRSRHCRLHDLRPRQRRSRYRRALRALSCQQRRVEFTRAQLCRQAGGRRITVLATAPGWVRTDMGPEPAAFLRSRRHGGRELP